jgi:hypothetical protein
VRGFVTGSTDTSLWTVYNNGVRNYCGNVIPDGTLTNIIYSESDGEMHWSTDVYHAPKYQYVCLLLSCGWMTEFLVAGMVKNQKLAANILTPTTKAADHDVPITPEEVSQFFLKFLSSCSVEFREIEYMLQNLHLLQANTNLQREMITKCFWIIL